MKKPDLKEIFLNLQDQMTQKLSSGRDVNFHATTKGDATEINWINWLRKYLPERYAVDKAFIIDSNGRFSEQIDLVIYDQQYSPFVFNQDGSIYIPAESVYGVFEVKQDIDRENFLYAAKKIKSVRLLNRTSAPIVHAGGEIDNPKNPFRILGGILTLDSGWEDTFGESFNTCIKEFDEYSQIDLGCILKEGGFTVSYEGKNFHSKLARKMKL